MAELNFERLASEPFMRVLTWHDQSLYASRWYLLPGGYNSTNFLALFSIATQGNNLKTTL